MQNPSESNLSDFFGHFKKYLITMRLNTMFSILFEKNIYLMYNVLILQDNEKNATGRLITGRLIIGRLICSSHSS